jgi:hypothetical protein
MLTGCAHRKEALLNLPAPPRSTNAASAPSDDRKNVAADTAERVRKRAEQNTHARPRATEDRAGDTGSETIPEPQSTSGTLSPSPKRPVWSVVESHRPDAPPSNTSSPSTTAQSSATPNGPAATTRHVAATVIACGLIAAILWLPRRLRA